MAYLYIKAFHIFFVVSWFAGLFYLPRLYVNLATATPDSAEYQRLLLMSNKLFRFMTPLAVLACTLGLTMMLGYGVNGGWLHAKLTLVTGLIGYHAYCFKLLKNFRQQRNTRSHVWFRVFNEIPVLVLLAVVILVVVKPF